MHTTPGLLSSDDAPRLGEMLGWVRRVVGFGTRRPGYSQSLQVEHWLANVFREFGLAEVRREPVPVNYWEPLTTSLEFAADATEFPCFPIPYTAWTASAGIESPTVFVGEGWIVKSLIIMNFFRSNSVN